MEKKSEGKTRKCLTLLGGRTSLLLCLSLMFQSSYAAGDSTVPEMGNMEIHQIAQQSSTIKGVVKDQKGEPLIGVSIVVKGTTNGTASDFDGNFTLDVPDNSTFIIRKTKCFDFWERNVLFPKTKRSFFRTPTLPFSA